MASISKVLAFSGVEKSIGRLKLLAKIDLELDRGEFVGLLAPAGSGKTALLHLALGLDAPDRGSVRVNGVDVLRQPQAARAMIGAVFEASVLEPDRSVRANLVYAADLFGLRRGGTLARIDALLERFGLRSHARDRVRSLAAPNRRRIEIIRALLHSPDLLLLNGIGEGLEPALRLALVDDVQRYAADNRMAALWATDEAEELATADRLAVLYRGTIGFDGSPAALLAATGKKTLAEAYAAASTAGVAA